MQELIRVMNQKSLDNLKETTKKKKKDDGSTGSEGVWYLFFGLITFSCSDSLSLWNTKTSHHVNVKRSSNSHDKWNRSRLLLSDGELGMKYAR